MKPVERSEIIDYVTYEEERAVFRAQVLEAKAPRRVHIGDSVTLLFENRLTVRYQIQEMMRAERMVKEADIRHEMDTYNELLGGDGELGCTMLIENDNPRERAEKLGAWVHLPEKIYALLEDGSRVRATFDEKQRDTEKLSSVQFLKFNTGGQIPRGFGVDMPELQAQTDLTDDQCRALREDLISFLVPCPWSFVTGYLEQQITKDQGREQGTKNEATILPAGEMPARDG